MECSRFQRIMKKKGNLDLTRPAEAASKKVPVRILDILGRKINGATGVLILRRPDHNTFLHKETKYKFTAHSKGESEGKKSEGSDGHSNHSCVLEVEDRVVGLLNAGTKQKTSGDKFDMWRFGENKDSALLRLSTHTPTQGRSRRDANGLHLELVYKVVEVRVSGKKYTLGVITEECTRLPGARRKKKRGRRRKT